MIVYIDSKDRFLSPSSTLMHMTIQFRLRPSALRRTAPFKDLSLSRKGHFIILMIITKRFFKNVRYKMFVEPTFTVIPKNIGSFFSRTCSRTCSCSRTRTEHEQKFCCFSRTRTELEQNISRTPRTRTEQERKKYACSFIPVSDSDYQRRTSYPCIREKGYRLPWKSNPY